MRNTMDFLNKPVSEMDEAEKDYMGLAAREAVEDIIRKHRQKSGDFFLALSMLLREEAQKRQPKGDE